MTAHSRCLWTVAVGLALCAPVAAQEPARFAAARGQNVAAVSANQHMANIIAEQLRQGGQLRQYSINIAYSDGTAELTGTVADQPQREEALRLVQGVPGVERVRDHLQFGGVAAVSGPVAQAQAVTPRPADAPPSLERAPTELGPTPRRSGEAAGQEPIPIFQAPAPGPYDVNQPKMPPYAWPTYAPYNNYSRVAYPQLYPHNSWPFIGPCHPFPKVPLGWRKVKLEWQDGCWWYSRHSNSHDWWTLRYW